MIKNPMQKEFFNKNAEQWDVISVHDLKRVDYITSLLKLKGEERIMDVGTGTGIMIPFYEKYLTSGSVLAVDYSENMVAMAKKKYPFKEHFMIRFEVKDLYDIDSFMAFDTIVCYSCFPHFPDQSLAVSILCKALKYGGKLMISHSCSRDKINQVHRTGGEVISKDYLPCMETMKKLFVDNGLEILFTQDDEDYFIIVGQKCAQ
ncbi:MAG: class I SAM-dependent methyltransferase [Parabacteroides sp.]